MKYVFKKNRKILSFVVIFIMIANALNALYPFVMKKILDQDILAKEFLMQLFLTYFMIHSILLLVKYIRNSVINKAMSKILKDLREKLFYHILKWDMTTYEKYNSSEIYTRLTADVDNVSSLFLGTIQVVLNDVLYIGTMVIFMFFADVRLAIFGSTAIFLNVGCSYLFTHQVAKCSKKILDKRDKENRQFSEMYHKNKLTFLFGLQKKNVDKMGQTLEE